MRFDTPEDHQPTATTYSDREAKEMEHLILGLLGNDDPTPWAGALCAETDPEAFFPEKGESTREAKNICAKCPLLDTCLQYAFDNGEQYGIWGGMSAAERRAHRKNNPHTYQDPTDLEEQDDPTEHDDYHAQAA